MTDAVVLSGPLYVVAGHAATPDVASVPRTVNPTARLYQPLALAARSGSAAVTAGAVASYFSPKGNAPLVLPALSVQVPLTEAVASSGPP